jgi:DNA mismatch endonuclease (patch repair protein)
MASKGVADIVDKQTRSRMMRGIRGKDTKPETALRKALHAKGLRYRLHTARLPGKPDIVFPKFNPVVFVHGCFWHRHKNCHFATTPKTRTEFWSRKFDANVVRDIRNQNQLVEMGWRVAVVWECGLRNVIDTANTAEQVEAWLRSEDNFLEVGIDAE